MISVQAAAMVLNRINSAYAPFVIEWLQTMSSGDKKCLWIHYLKPKNIFEILSTLFYP
jgi:hypothetical protein